MHRALDAELYHQRPGGQLSVPAAVDAISPPMSDPLGIDRKSPLSQAHVPEPHSTGYSVHATYPPDGLARPPRNDRDRALLDKCRVDSGHLDRLYRRSALYLHAPLLGGVMGRRVVVVQR